MTGYDWDVTGIDSLGLATSRAFNCLKRAGIHTVGQLIGLTESDVMDIRQMGTVSLRDITSSLSDVGLTLKQGGAARTYRPLPYSAITKAAYRLSDELKTDGKLDLAEAFLRFAELVG